MTLQWENAPYGIKAIFVDIDKGCQGAGRWSISLPGKREQKQGALFIVRLNTVNRKHCTSLEEAKSWVAFETNR